MRINQEDLDKRHGAILQLVRELGEVRSETVADTFHISMVTVRRDLKLLEGKGLLRRTHGGARALGLEPVRVPDSEDVSHCREAISRYAAGFVDDGDTLFINGSRTALHLLKYIDGKRVFVNTNNGWAIDEVFPANISVRLVGGLLREHVMVGEYTMRNLLEMSANKAFLGCAAVYEDGEFRYDIPTEIGINEAMVTRTDGRLFMLADHTKLISRADQNNRYGSCTYDRPITLITDSLADEGIVGHLREKGIEILIVPV